MRRIALFATVTALIATATAGSTAAIFPEVISLPNGWRPEGIATSGLTFYVGSLANGGVYKGDFVTGEGAPVVPAQTGRVAVGVDYDRGRLFVAGGNAGDGYVYDAKTGAEIASYNFTDAAPTFVNDVVVTPTAAWFTDSRKQVLYRVALSSTGAPGAMQVVPLTGDLVVVNPATQNNINGIDATLFGTKLVIVQSNLGKLFTVDPGTGVTDEIELAGGDALNGDGILLDLRTLYVVKNFQNRIAVIRLDSDLGAGTVVRHITHAGFDVPTTIDNFAFLWMFAVNARFSLGNPPPPDATYTIVRVPKFGG